MAVRTRGLYNSGEGVMTRFYVGTAGATEGALQMSNTGTITDGSEILPATTTSAADLLGVATETVVYSTTQGDFDGFPSYKASGEEGTVAIICDPLQVISLVAAGGATAGTALSSAAAGANIVINETANAAGTTIIDTSFTISMNGGLIMGRTGNNAGIVRRISADTDNTSLVVTVPFPNTIAVDDEFIRVPWDRSCVNVQLTSDFTEADATIVRNTGAELRVLDVDFDVVNSAAIVHVVAADHFYNPA